MRASDPDMTKDFTYLPNVGSEGIVKGRVPKEGYQRGWGLQFGDLASRIAAETLYQDAAAASQDRSIMSDEKRMNLYVIMTRFLPRLSVKHIIEFGSYRGGNALFMARVMKHVDPEAVIFALDTYRGMPDTDKTIDAHSAGDFGDSSLIDFEQAIERAGLSNIRPIQGLFQDTFPRLAQHCTFALAHIDADIYSAVKFAQDAVWPHMTEGGYVVYDDADVSSCLGATQAAEELIMDRRIHSEQVWPHFVFRANLLGQ